MVEPLSLPAHEIDRLISRSPLFKGLDHDARAALAGDLEPILLPGGEVLVSEGDIADCMYLVVGGRLRATYEGDGLEITVGEIGRDEVVGEMALITRDERSATVRAIRDTQLLRLYTDAFSRLVADHPDALRAVSSTVVARLVRSFQATHNDSPVNTLALVPLTPGARAGDFDRILIDAFERVGVSAALVSPSTIESVFSPATATDPEGSDDRDRLASWLDRLEADHEVVVYRTDTERSAWTQLCTRQADVVVLVAEAAHAPELRPTELELGPALESVRTELVLLHEALTIEPRGTGEWLRRRSVHRHHHVRENNDEDADRVARLFAGRGVGLVLSGGGARGMAHVGVIRALRGAGVPIDAVGGSSIGAVMAIEIARELDEARSLRDLRYVLLDGGNTIDVTFPQVSLASGARLTSRAREVIGDIAVEDTWRDYFCVSCNLSRGEAVVHRRGPLWRAVRSSFAIPGIFPPLPHDGDLLVDGGVVDNIPVGRMRDLHHGISVIAVDVGTSHDLTAGDLPDTGVVSGRRVLLDKLNPLRRDQDITNIARILMRLTELSSTGPVADSAADLTIRPDVDGFGMLDFASMADVVEAGYVAGREAVAEWQADGALAEALVDA